jgi:hypothetical protein
MKLAFTQYIALRSFGRTLAYAALALISASSPAVRAQDPCATECDCAQALHLLTPNPGQEPACFVQVSMIILAATDGCCGIGECPENACAWILRVAATATAPCLITIIGPHALTDDDDGHATLTDSGSLGCGFPGATLFEVWIEDVLVKKIEGTCNSCSG